MINYGIYMYCYTSQCTIQFFSEYHSLLGHSALQIYTVPQYELNNNVP